MKVITKNVNIENEEFALIHDTQKGRDFYGTIPYTELNERGCMKRALNGFEMCIADTIPEALRRRTNQIAFRKYKEEGHTEAELIAFIMAQE